MRIMSAIMLILMVAFPSEAQGLRDHKVGDKLPATEALSVVLPGGNKMLLVLDSSRDKDASFFDEIVPLIGKTGDIKLILVDTNQEMDDRIASTFGALKIEKQYVPDVERKIYADLGIIVLPTLLFLTKDNILHSYIAGYRSNLKMSVQSYLESLLKEESPENIAQKAEKTMDERQVDKLLEQGFRLMVSRNYEIAHNTFKKIIEIEPGHEVASLGIGYALMFNDQIDESLAHFSEIRESNETRRVLLGYFLCQAIKDPSDESLQQISSLSHLEPRFFFVIFRVAEVLDKAGKCEESKKSYKHAYDVLLRMYRRGS
jgi:tetratricopeptide (TPR) repeat protein